LPRLKCCYPCHCAPGFARKRLGSIGQYPAN
jgi:hypothetical protein